ncbi:hypothetical protein Salat_2617500 [Sesamum alatum]|uniref:Uncharacterized protein n=1 Tax=Sesamum alatum TaxID=300844 RepID=A0AAE1XNG9_9LAMI|nr:hypothetical protein Salat_2617500 [Sesamum alatum]
MGCLPFRVYVSPFESPPITFPSFHLHGWNFSLPTSLCEVLCTCPGVLDHTASKLRPCWGPAVEATFFLVFERLLFVCRAKVGCALTVLLWLRRYGVAILVSLAWRAVVVTCFITLEYGGDRGTLGQMERLSETYRSRGVGDGLWDSIYLNHQLCLVGRLLSTCSYRFEVLRTSIMGTINPVKGMEGDQVLDVGVDAEVVISNRQAPILAQRHGKLIEVKGDNMDHMLTDLMNLEDSAQIRKGKALSVVELADQGVGSGDWVADKLEATLVTIPLRAKECGGEAGCVGVGGARCGLDRGPRSGGGGSVF